MNFNANRLFLSYIGSLQLQLWQFFVFYFVLVERSAYSENKLIIVSYDAFRYDYFQRNVTPFMNNLRLSGSYSDYMKNVFITSTFPNHHSIATGLYAENHGVIDNEYYDVNTNKKFSYSHEMYHYDDKIVPIWILNEMHGKHSGAMMWPGSDMEYQNKTPTFYQGFNYSINWTDRIDTLVSWFKHNTTPINLGLLYIEEPDHHGHGYGVNHPVFNEMLQKLDSATRYLHDKLIENKLHDVSVIHLSDHGMTTVTYENIIEVRQFLNSTEYSIAGRALGLNLFPKNNQTENMYLKLKKASEEYQSFDVYMRDAIPERYNYRNNPRIGEIFLSARDGFAFYPLADKIPTYMSNFDLTIVTNKTEFGVHGYDNEMPEMRPFFFAYGPAFKKQCHIEPFNNVDIYQLVCEILKLKCPPNNGTLAQLKNCLTFPVSTEQMIQFDLILVGSCICVILAMFTLLLCRCQSSKVDTVKDRPNHPI